MGPEDQLMENDKLRSAVRADHFLLPSLLSSQDLQGCIATAKKKLETLLQLQDQLLADLPAAYMEAYEFLAIAKAMKYPVREDPEIFRKKAENLASLLGDKFVNK